MFIKYIVIVMNVDYLWNNLVSRNVIVIEFKLWLKVIVQFVVVFLNWKFLLVIILKQLRNLVF